jgi:hypothetical protein
MQPQSTIRMMQVHMHVIKGSKSRCECVVIQSSRLVTSLFVVLLSPEYCCDCDLMCQLEVWAQVIVSSGLAK